MPSARPIAARPVGTWGNIWRFGSVVLLGGLVWVALLSQVPENASEGRQVWVMILDPALGVTCAGLAWWRRRWPVPIACAAAVLSTFSATASGASALTLGSVATRRRLRELAVVIPFYLASGVVSGYLEPEGEDPSGPWWVSPVIGVLFVMVVVAIGNAVGSRRDLVVSLRERAETAEREQQARIAGAAAAERTRIAREMHDVLAHRISLVAMHAGALTYRTDLTPAEQTSAARTIETNAHRALQDLRQVLGVLREGPADSVPEPPQPGLDDVPRLVDDAVNLGMRIDYASTAQGEAPAGAGRTAYRVVQEALTNARKHAPGTAVRVRVDGDEPTGLTVEVHNARSVRSTAPTLPMSGLGLLGLRERVVLAGGSLTHGVDGDGGFTVRASIPWRP